MKFVKKSIKKTVYFVKQNYLIAIFCLIIFFVGLVILFKIFTKKEETIYVRVKVSQGLWWATTLKPSIWMINSIQKGDTDKSGSGIVKAEILTVRSYPWYSSNQYDIFLDIRLQTDYDAKKNIYTFNRSQISVGSPIEFQFSKSQVTGTIINFSDKPFLNESVEKIITLKKTFAQEWEYNAIKVGDTYFDGNENVFEILDKQLLYSDELYTNIGNRTIASTEKPVGIEVKAKVKLQKYGNTYLFHYDEPVAVGRNLIVYSSNYVFVDYYISEIE